MNQQKNSDDKDPINPYQSPDFSSAEKHSSKKRVKKSRSGLRITIITFVPFAFYSLLFFISLIFTSAESSIGSKDIGAASLGASSALCVFTIPSLLYGLLAEAARKKLDFFFVRMIFPIVQCFTVGFILKEEIGFIGAGFGFVVGILLLFINDTYYEEYLPLTPQTEDLKDEGENDPPDFSFLNKSQGE